MNLKTSIGQLRALAIGEGISYLLLGVTVPIKYILEIGWPNQVIGMIHGILFIAYCIWVLIVANKVKWGLKVTLICLISSLIPIATFIVDKSILKPVEERL